MKLVVGGSTGFIGAEVVRQAIAHASITSVVALGRREAVLSPNCDSSGAPPKYTSAICDDFGNYSSAVVDALKGADACIWSVCSGTVQPGIISPAKYDKITPGNRLNIEVRLTLIQEHCCCPVTDAERAMGGRM